MENLEVTLNSPEIDNKLFEKAKDDLAVGKSEDVQKADALMETGADSPVDQNQQIKDFQSQFMMQKERKNRESDAQMNDEYSFDFNEEDFNKIKT